MQFIIPIETKVRELESKILLLSKILSKKKIAQYYSEIIKKFLNLLLLIKCLRFVLKKVYHLKKKDI